MSQDDTEAREIPGNPQAESRDERPAELKQKHSEVASGTPDDDGGGGGNSESERLDDLLKKLKEERPNAAAAQVDNDIADLEKLIADAKAAKESYDEETVEKLTAEENRLTSEQEILERSLEAALGEAKVEEIKGIEAEQLCVVLNAKNAVEDAEATVEEKKEDATKKSETLAEKTVSLDLWRKPGDSIAKRHKRAQTLIDEIKKLRNGQKRGEAFWKLALGCPEELSEHGCPKKLSEEELSDDGCPEALSEQDFLHKVLDLPPPIVDPGELESRIKAAWTEFKAARKESVKANVELEDAEASLKAKKADYADKSKNLIKAITDALAELEAASDAA